MNIKKICAALTALTMCLSFAACSDKDSSSAVSSQADSSSAVLSEADSSTPDNSEEVSQSDSSQNEQGSLIKKAAEFFGNTNYEYDMTVQTTDTVINVKRVVKGNDFYQVDDYGVFKLVNVTVGGEHYTYNTLLSAYSVSGAATALDTIVLQVVDENLPQTNSQINADDAEQYDVEEYTYTGDTYITVLDFCFDKQTGDLVKYTSTYSVEGDDNIVETRTVNKMITDTDNSSADVIDETGFDLSFKNTMSDFDNMTQDERLGFCQTICSNQGISTDDMNEYGVTTDDFKNISYDDFFGLVFNFSNLMK